MEETQVLKEVLKSRKMKFSNKLMICKYLETIKKGGRYPESLTGWKSAHFW